jgi:glutaredoxin
MAAAILISACSPGDVEQTVQSVRGLLGSATSSDAAPPAEDGSRGPESATRLYYQFVDAGGRVRFVERLDEVPEGWRARVGFVEMATPPPLTPGDARRARAQPPGAGRASGVGRALAAGPPTVLFYSADWCGWCRKAKAHMDGEGIRYELRDVDVPSVMSELVTKTGQKGIPAFDVDGRILTGFDPDGLERLLAAR